MSLIQRQDSIVSTLSALLRTQSGCALAGQKSKLYRASVYEMQKAGYTKVEANDSFTQCLDMAQLNVMYSV